MRTRLRLLHLMVVCCAIAVVWCASARAQATIVLDGDATPINVVVTTDGPAFVLAPFVVPEGTREIELEHSTVGDSNDDVIDVGVDDPRGFRGWGGGNRETVIIGERASSRSYRVGPLPAGTWQVVLGRARVSRSATVRLSVRARSTPTLNDDDDRNQAMAAVVVNQASRFYAGDFHVHSLDSGDASATLQQIDDLARDRGLDFVVVTDHNTDAHVPHLAAHQQRSSLLWVPGIEFTTYDGHLGAIGVSQMVDQKLGLSTTIDDAAASFRAQGALVSVNHPVLDIGDACIGCAWQHDLSVVDGVEVATSGYDDGASLFQVEALRFFEGRIRSGEHVAPLGGSDDHRAGVDLGRFQSPVGSPTTLVEAEELSTAAILQAMRDSRVVVKTQGPEDPMIRTTTLPARDGDTVFVPDGGSISFAWSIQGAQAGDEFQIVHDGVVVERVTLPAGNTRIERELVVTADVHPAVRTQIMRDDGVRVLTGYAWTALAPGGCSCAGLTRATHDQDLSPVGVVAALAALSCVVAWPRRWRRRERPPWHQTQSCCQPRHPRSTHPPAPPPAEAAPSC
jgi:hypothetical protein